MPIKKILIIAAKYYGILAVTMFLSGFLGTFVAMLLD